VAVLGEPLILGQVQLLCLLGDSVDVETIFSGTQTPHQFFHRQSVDVQQHLDRHGDLVVLLREDTEDFLDDARFAHDLAETMQLLSQRVDSQAELVNELAILELDVLEFLQQLLCM
jgi:hypothetical protein